jgi:hypothetical protein
MAPTSALRLMAMLIAASLLMRAGEPLMVTY